MSLELMSLEDTKIIKIGESRSLEKNKGQPVFADRP